MLARLDEVRDEIGIAGVEADAHAREVRALGDAVHREHAVEPGGEDRRGRGRELAVALVARDDHAVTTTPRRHAGEVVGTGSRCRRVARLVDPEHQRAAGVVVADRVDVEMPLRVERDRHGTAAGEDRAHLVARVRDRGIQHGVARGVAQAQEVRQRGDELLRPDARTYVRAFDRDAEAAPDPRRRGIAQRHRPGRRRVAVRRRDRVGGGAARDLGHRIARRADRAVDHAPRKRVGQALQRVEPFVGVWGRDESAGGRHLHRH